MNKKSIFKDGANKNLTHPKTQKGITLIALIITIIVMLILVGVSISVALNTGLFKAAQGAAKNTEAEKVNETKLSTGKVTIGGIIYNSLEDYTSGNVALPEGWREATPSPTGWNTNAVTAMTDGTKTVPLPKGFMISQTAGEHTYSEGLVIKDKSNGNEFVWVPVDNAASYTVASFGPLTATDSMSGAAYDSQSTLDYYYGTNYYNYANDFDYAKDKENVEKSIRTYGGFYVGRYETTYDSKDETTGVVSGIGVKPGKNVLSAENLLKPGRNSPTDSNDKKSNESYYYRWWGLYKAQKDMYANNPNVGSLMISSNQSGAILAHTGYGGKVRDDSTYTNKPDLSGSAYRGSNPAKYDEAKNIYDLAGNLTEWTSSAAGLDFRLYVGGSCFDSVSSGGNGSHDAAHAAIISPDFASEVGGSRSALYIK